MSALQKPTKIRDFIHDSIPTILFLQKCKNLAYQQCLLPAKCTESLQDAFLITDSAGISFFCKSISSPSFVQLLHFYLYLFNAFKRLLWLEWKGGCYTSNISPVG